MRAMFHRVEHRMSFTMAGGACDRALAQKLDAIDHEVGSLHDRARLLIDEVAAKMTETPTAACFTAVDSHRLVPAANARHRLLGHEHQRHVVQNTTAAVAGARPSRSRPARSAYGRCAGCGVLSEGKDRVGGVPSLAARG